MSALLKHGIAAAMCVFLAGCTQSTNKAAATPSTEAAAEPTAPPQIVTAKTAFWPMYTAAHQWAPDVVLLRVTAKQISGFSNEGGKAALWEAAFGSPSLREYRVYTYAIANAQPNIYKGVVAGLEMPWGGVTRTAMPVDTSLFNADSDTAYAAASTDASEWLKKNPGKPLTAFEIGDTDKFPVPVWYLLWGSKQSGYAALVDASSGKVLRHK